VPRRSPLRSARTVVGAVIALTVGFGLAACAPDESETAPTPTASAVPSVEPTAEAPAFHADGTADDNLPLFAAVTAQVWATDDRAAGRAYIDALVAAGFDKQTMQVTNDQTTVGNPAESIQFSVAWGDAECLVGQVGPSTGDPHTIVIDQLAEGRCLVGTTRAIDW